MSKLLTSKNYNYLQRLKKTFLRYALFGYALFLNCSPIFSQNIRSPAEFQFIHLTEREGLAHGTVHVSIMDDEGFMWFGTQDGLSRWDGKNIKNYYPRPEDSTALSGALEYV